MNQLTREQLFTGVPTPAEAIAPFNQSASPLAPYVLSEMIPDLAAIRDGAIDYGDLRAKQEGVLVGTAERIAANNDPTVAKTTQLDLAFMLGGYLPTEKDAFKHAPPHLLGLLRQQADRFGVPHLMDYDLIIDVNSDEHRRNGHMRTFTGDPSERDFYLGHHLSEPYAKTAAYELRNLTDAPHHLDARETLASAADNMDTFFRYMQRYISMSRESFGGIRPYLISYPDGTRNASGAFMPSVPLTELALRPPTPEQDKFLDTAMPYYPQWSKDVIANWRERSARGLNVMDLAETGRINIKDDEIAKHSLMRLIDGFTNFRLAHHAATRKQIPEAFEGSPVGRKGLKEMGERDIMAEGVKGTADYNLTNLLGGTVSRTMALRDQVEDL
jgi:hypothetical protein